MVSCKDVTFKIFGFSLTTLNLIISLLITIIFTKIYKCSKSYLSDLEKSMQSLMKSYSKNFNKFFFTSTKKFEGIIDIQKDIYTLSKQT